MNPLRSSRFSSRVLQSLSVATLLSVAACTTGIDDKASFSYGSFGSLSTPLAAGASDSIAIDVPSGTTVARATSSDPTILAVGPVTAPAGDASAYSAPITGFAPGSVTFTIYDHAGNVIDQTQVNVAPTTSIELGIASDVTVLQGSSFAVHATTIGAGGTTLAGTGAIRFAYTGAATASQGAGAFCSGDCGGVTTIASGDGTVTASASATTASFAIHAVPATAIDAITMGSGTLQVSAGNLATTTYTLKSAGTTVYANGSETQCASSRPDVATVSNDGLGGGLAGGATGLLLVTGGVAGTAVVTCTANGRSATLNVTVQ